MEKEHGVPGVGAGGEEIRMCCPRGACGSRLVGPDEGGTAWTRSLTLEEPADASQARKIPEGFSVRSKQGPNVPVSSQSAQQCHVCLSP